jgi:hypothetical protein
MPLDVSNLLFLLAGMGASGVVTDYLVFSPDLRRL